MPMLSSSDFYEVPNSRQVNTTEIMSEKNYDLKVTDLGPITLESMTHSQPEKLKTALELAELRADEWKAMAGRLAEKIAELSTESYDTLSGMETYCKECQQRNPHHRESCELNNAIQAYDAILAKEKGAR